MAMYHDDMAAELFSEGASYDRYTFAAGAATAYCQLLHKEKRNLDYDKYFPLCDAINNRTRALIMCGNEPDGCSETIIMQLDETIRRAEPLARDLKENKPYVAYVFGEVVWKASGTGETIKVF